MTGRWRVRPANRPPAGRQVPPKGADEASPRSGVKPLVPAAADNFAPRRERFFCLRRPHFFQQRKKWGKERRQKLRFCTSSARYACSPLSVFPHVTGVFLIAVVPPTVPAQLSAAAAACCGRNLSSTELQPSNISYPVPDGHTYLCRLAAAKARFDNRQPGRSKYPYRGWGKRSRKPPRR